MPIFDTRDNLNLDDKTLLSMSKQEKEAYILAVKVWYKVNHKELDPKHL